MGTAGVREMREDKVGRRRRWSQVKFTKNVFRIDFLVDRLSWLDETSFIIQK